MTTTRAARLVRWWGDRPLRSRLAAIAALVVALAVGVTVAVAYVETGRSLRGQLDDQLQHQATQLQRQAFFSSQSPFPVVQLRVEPGVTGGYVQVLSTTGQAQQPQGQLAALPISPSDAKVAATQSGGGFRRAEVSGVPVRMLTTPLIDGYALQVALPSATVDSQLNHLAIAFTLVALVALALAVLFAWWLTRTALTPVARLTETAERITDTKDLTHRIPTETRGDEIGRLAASFNSMLDSLSNSLTAQRQLVTDASHELRTPLASLRTNTEVLHDFDRLSPAQREQVISGIVGQVDELTSLVADVVELARGDEPEQEAENIAFEGVVAHAVAQARRHWPAVSFSLDSTAVTVRGVANRLDRAVRNLLDNAAKFSGPGGSVEVHLSPDGALFVRDHGPGISDAALPQVFERFYRADEARGMPGSGLGLAIVKQAAERHRGTVMVRNADGGGVVAVLQIPSIANPDVEPVETGSDSSGDVQVDQRLSSTPSTPGA
ncbi:MAG: two-component system, OmpR family, sensor histidine kinase MprB [Frankiales bacterium]|jgi:two-component system sensor histidine kinase MprB|nr:two-component system, OmpR family, sensor histidine kinase MprB [Frankiales bacterium]